VLLLITTVFFFLVRLELACPETSAQGFSIAVVVDAAESRAGPGPATDCFVGLADDAVCTCCADSGWEGYGH